MAVYLLDKNVVEDIKKSNKGISGPGAAFARAIDRKANTVSALLAILEGGQQRPQSDQEFHNQLKLDSHAVSRFYKHARTDFEYLQVHGAGFAQIFAPHVQTKTSALLPLTMKLQALVVLSPSLVNARSMLKEIDALASEHLVELSHPLITCAVSCMYGYGPARKVLKPAFNPKPAGAYNAIADIRLLMESAFFRSMWNETGRHQNVYLYSQDKNLNAFDRALQLKAVTAPELAEPGIEAVRFTSKIRDELLPALVKNPKEREHVFDLLRTSRGDLS